MKFQWLKLLFLSLLVFSCAQQPTKPAVKPLLDEPQKAAVSEKSLSPDVIFNVIAGEVEAQRGQMDEAFKHMLAASRLAGDAVSAERAVRVALFNKDVQAGLQAVKLWVELSPHDLAARQMAALLSIKAGQSDELVLEQLRFVIRLSEEEGRDGFLQAMRALSPREHPQKSLKILQKLVKLSSNDASANYVVALVAVMAKQVDVAEKFVRYALTLDADLDKAWVLLSRIMMVNQQNDEAVTLLYKAASRLPDSVLLHTALAQTLLEQDKVSDAYQQYQRLRLLSPDDVKVYFSLGILAIQLGNLEQANDYLQEMIEKGGSPSDAYYHLGWIAEIEKNDELALSYYQQVVQGKWRIDAGSREALLVAKQGRVAQARDKLQRLRISIPGSLVQLYVVEAEILQNYGPSEQVLPLYHLALQEFPHNTELLYARAMHYVDIDELALMEVDLLGILQVEPLHVNALNTLGYVLADKTTRFDEALTYVAKALALKPRSAAIMDSMGWVKYRQGDYEGALSYLSQAYDLMQDAEISAHYGEVLWFSGDKDKALRVWREAIRSYPESAFLKKARKMIRAVE